MKTLMFSRPWRGKGWYWNVGLLASAEYNFLDSRLTEAEIMGLTHAFTRQDNHDLVCEMLVRFLIRSSVDCFLEYPFRFFSSLTRLGG
jgi:hypothetical protein